jgi:hypothetical protein
MDRVPIFELFAIECELNNKKKSKPELEEKVSK